MRLRVEESIDNEEVEVIIKCSKNDEHIKRLIGLINTQFTNMIGKLDGENVIINLQNIYYFEAVENKVFAYESKTVYEVPYKIQELNLLLQDTTFIQISRAIILNVTKIQKVKPLVNGRILAVLDNTEKVIITRVYSYDFKERIRKEVK